MFRLSKVTKLISRSSWGQKRIRAPQMSNQMRCLASKAGDKGASGLREVDTVDGCTAVTHAAYGLSDTSFIFPITPSSPMAELAETWCQQGVRNVYGDVCKVSQLQSEGGAAGALHGALVAGSLATTFTASQGLLLMVPNMYKISGELHPCVIHVAARAIAGASLSIFGDHQDIMACRATGFAILGGGSVQEAADHAVIAHMSTLRTRVPFIAYMDGFRVSHCVEKVELPAYREIRKLIDFKAVAEHRSRSLNPMRPKLMGTNQNPDVYFQTLEASNQYYDLVPGVVEQEMDAFGMLIGRQYKLFDYYGAADATDAVVVMGSGATVLQEAIKHMNEVENRKTGVIVPRLFRPWSKDDFLKVIPETVKKVSVLDRTKEAGSAGEPLYLDVCSALMNQGVKVYRGRYGLGQKEFTPAMAISVFDNMMLQNPKDGFTVGIEDDLTHLNLVIGPEPNVIPKGTTECLFYGFGSDGTVGANKNAIKIIGDNTDLYAQGAFAYGSSKAGGITTSHLRFGPDPKLPYYAIAKADYLACHTPMYVDLYNLGDHVKPGGTFVLNSNWNTVEAMSENLPPSLKRQLAVNNAKLFNIDAFEIAAESDMGRLINNVMQAAFFKLSGIIPYEEAIKMFKDAIYKTYISKGEKVVEKNLEMVDKTVSRIVEIKIPELWKSESEAVPLHAEAKFAAADDEFVRRISGPMAMMEGDKIPVSTIPVGGVMPMGTTETEKRGVALEVPEVDMDKCTQCNYCSFACPHAVIRPFLLSQEETDQAPNTFVTRKAKGGTESAGLNFRIQVSALDCTGCTVCVRTCPDDALRMVPMEHTEQLGHEPNWDYAMSLTDRSHRFETASVKGSQFMQPLLEFHGACAGCGETPYVKLVTQMFGERMIIANATGCSSIWGAPYGSNPYTTRKTDGRGPAWGNSLFEDAAEYGFGMAVTTQMRRMALRDRVNQFLAETDEGVVSAELYSQLDEWRNNFGDVKICNRLAATLPGLLDSQKQNDGLLEMIAMDRDLFAKISVWTIGGDGWAYDIGYGGLDHVLASGHDVNILVLDTEVYSNTGGQTSKATPVGAITKFSASGKLTNKKELAQMAASYGNVYVSNVAMGASMQQTMKSFVEADSWDGPSLVIAYAPCIEHKNVDGLDNMMEHMANVVNSGYFPLWRYNPILKRDQKNPFILDTKKLTADVKVVLESENRYLAMKRSDPERYQSFVDQLNLWIDNRHEQLKGFAAGNPLEAIARNADGEAEVGNQELLILYGSETGNTEELAHRMGDMCRGRNYKVQVLELDEMCDLEELSEHKNVLVMAATCGEGDFPMNCQAFWEEIKNTEKHKPGLFKDMNFSVFALGDSSYHEFCSVGKDLDSAFIALGASRVQEIGLGNDQDEDKFETAFDEWLPDYWRNTNAPEPVNDHLIPAAHFGVSEIRSSDKSLFNYQHVVPPNAKLLPIVSNTRETPDDYDRIIRHIKFDTREEDLPFLLGDVLTIIPENDAVRVASFLDFYGFDGAQMFKIQSVKEQMDARRLDAYRRPRTLSQVFTQVVDILGRPNKAFYKALSRFAIDEEEKAQLEHIASDEGKEAYSNLIGETVTYDDVLRMFPSARPPLEHLLSIVPCIKPRLYSIASSQRYNPDEAELMIVILDWDTPTGKSRRGLCTDYINRVNAGSDAVCWITSGTFNFPVDPMTPMLMAGLGTGLAPFRAFAQERKWMQDSLGQQTGPMWLFYGCRYEAKEFVFKEELTHMAETNVITELRPAFSRDQKEKIYVQNRIEEGGKQVYEDLVVKKGYFYICGQAGETERGIIDAVKKTFVMGGMKEEEADAEWEKIHSEGRYCPELY